MPICSKQLLLITSKRFFQEVLVRPENSEKQPWPEGYPNFTFVYFLFVF